MNINRLSKAARIAFYAMATAIVCVLTLSVRIPVPATKGYVNIGDCAIFIFSIIFGPVCGLICGGIGSSLADILGGYPHWAIFTLIIKSIEGLICGYIGNKKYYSQNNKKIKILYLILATIISAILMVVGYFFASFILYGSFYTALSSVPENGVQGIVSAVLAITILLLINFTKLLSDNEEK